MNLPFQSSPESSVAPEKDALPPLIAALLRPEAYRHPADDLRLHETHISWVVLAGPYAFKIKKPVNFGFVDFSTADRRAAACAEEVRLNRRLCPDVYRGVAHIVERGGAYFIGGAGRPVEPAVWMRRLPSEGMLPNRLAAGTVEATLFERIARRLARFHAAAATGPGVDEYGSLDAIRANWDENFAQTAPFLGQTLPPATHDEIRRYIEDFLAGQVDLLRRRAATGRVRDGHGDLHAANICVEGRRLHLFDCLEFNPRLRCADVAAEVAFLAMDLDYCGRADLAVAFVDAYVRAAGDRELLDLLAFYKCYRAYVRGKVLSLRLAEPATAPPARDASAPDEQLVEEARAYFDLARTYARPPARPRLIVTLGLPASGKTRLAQALAQRLALIHLSSDVVRKELAGTRPTERHRSAFGEGLYSAALTRRTYATLRLRAAWWLRRGHSVVLDATFGKAPERAAVRRLAARLGADLVVLVCQADEATLRARLAARLSDPQTASDARPEIWPELRAAFSEPADLPGAVALDTTRPLPDVVEQALTILRA